MLALSLALLVATPVPLALAPSSRLWIEGDSNAHPWSCTAQRVEVSAAAQLRAPGEAPALDKLEVSVPVQLLRCGNDTMDEKLRDALKAKQHPRIDFMLSAMAELPGAVAHQHRLKVTGKLSIAGRERSVTLLAIVTEESDGTYRAVGNTPLNMSDYGVEPPTAMLGLLKTYDRIVVRFDLRTRVPTPTSAPLPALPPQSMETP